MTTPRPLECHQGSLDGGRSPTSLKPTAVSLLPWGWSPSLEEFTGHISILFIVTQGIVVHVVMKT